MNDIVWLAPWSPVSPASPLNTLPRLPEPLLITYNSDPHRCKIYNFTPIFYYGIMCSPTRGFEKYLVYVCTVHAKFYQEPRHFKSTHLSASIHLHRGIVDLCTKVPAISQYLWTGAIHDKTFGGNNPNSGWCGDGRLLANRDRRSKSWLRTSVIAVYRYSVCHWATLPSVLSCSMLIPLRK